MANDKGKSKSLFQDPFMDLEGMGESGQGKAVEEVAVEVAVEPGTKKSGTTTAKVEHATKRKAAGKAEAKARIRKSTATEATAKPKAERKTMGKVKPKTGSGKRTRTKAATKPRVVKKGVVEAKSKPKTRKGTTTKAKAKPELEKEPTAEVDIQSEPVGDVAAKSQSTHDIEPVEIIAEPEERTSFLEELIATIDEEVQEAFGPGAMGDLTPAKQVNQAEEEQHVIFSLAGTEYAVHIDNVTEIGEPREATLVPNVPNWVLGVANLRGDIISMVDLRVFLGMEPTGYGQDKRMIVAQARDEEFTTGLIVDRVSGIHHLDVGRISEPTAPIEDQVAPYLRGVYQHDGHLVVVLDFDKLLLSSEMCQF